MDLLDQDHLQLHRCTASRSTGRPVGSYKAMENQTTWGGGASSCPPRPAVELSPNRLHRRGGAEGRLRRVARRPNVLQLPDDHPPRFKNRGRRRGRPRGRRAIAGHAGFRAGAAVFHAPQHARGPGADGGEAARVIGAKPLPRPHYGWLDAPAVVPEPSAEGCERQQRRPSPRQLSASSPRR